MRVHDRQLDKRDEIEACILDDAISLKEPVG
jgi:hypothetical protein